MVTMDAKREYDIRAQCAQEAGRLIKREVDAAYERGREDGRDESPALFAFVAGVAACGASVCIGVAIGRAVGWL